MYHSRGGLAGIGGGAFLRSIGKQASEGWESDAGKTVLAVSVSDCRRSCRLLKAGSKYIISYAVDSGMFAPLDKMLASAAEPVTWQVGV